MNGKKIRVSLKVRIFAIFFSILSATILIFVVSFYRYVSKSTVENLNKEYLSMVNDLNDTSQNLLWKLTLSSQQLLTNEDIQNTICLYEACTDLYQKQQYYSDLLNQISTLTMSETDIALLFFSDPVNDEIIYSSLPLNKRITASCYLYENDLFKYYGPSASQSEFLSNPVFSLERIGILPNGNPIIFSAESGLYSLDRNFENLKQHSAYVIFTNESGDILYSSFPSDVYPDINISDLLSQRNSEYHIFSQKPSQGWSTYVIVPHSVYTSQYKDGIQGFTRMAVIFSIFLALSAFGFWQSIYRPLKLFDHALEQIVTDHEYSGENPSSIPEFDFIFRKIMLLQKQVQEMLAHAVIQEQANTKMQLEKLRAQINPHFLMNTLNTVHWLALMNGQTEIDSITQSLSHLLSYNLDKDNYNTNLQRELNAVNEYVHLQKVRYEFTYTQEVQPSVSNLNYPCPKFILQPLIENSLSHGYREHMDIMIRITILDSEIEIIVSDTGTGMDQSHLETLQETLRSSQILSAGSSMQVHQHSGKGIGLSYVFGILQLYYHALVDINIESNLNMGTTFTIHLPKLKGRGYDVENTDY